MALGVIIGGAIFLLGGGTPSSGPSHPPPSTSPPTPPRQSFVFPLTETTAVATGRGNASGARQAATRIQATLSAFYDAAFMEPKTWKQGVPAAAWNTFARPVQGRAKADAASLTLGEAGSSIDRLSLSNASLSVRVLLDPGGRPQAAVATVVFEASGTLTGGQPVLVSNRGSFLLQPAGNRWLVVGYPSVKTEVETPSPSPSPGISGSPTATTSASPSAGASP